MTSHNSSLLTEDDRALLVKVSSLLEEIIETFEIQNDETAMNAIHDSEKDLEAGRVRDYNAFIRELKEPE